MRRRVVVSVASWCAVVLAGLALGVALPANGQDVDIDKIFPPDPARELVLISCSGACHSFAPLVIGQRTPEKWRTVFATHRDYVSGLSEEQLEAMYRYLSANFNPEKPVPELPPALLEAWSAQ